MDGCWLTDQQTSIDEYLWDIHMKQKKKKKQFKNSFIHSFISVHSCGCLVLFYGPPAALLVVGSICKKKCLTF